MFITELQRAIFMFNT